MISFVLSSTVNVTFSAPGGDGNEAPDDSTAPSNTRVSPCVATAVTCAGLAAPGDTRLRGTHDSLTIGRPSSSAVPTQKSTVRRALVPGSSDSARIMSGGISASAALARARSISATLGAQ